LTGARIMANIAKKRGRPKTIPDELRAVWSDINKRRQQDNLSYMVYIYSLLYPDFEEKKLESEPAEPDFVFLWDLKTDKMKTTILAELGRLAVRYRDGDKIAVQAARVICEHKMNTARALAYLRRFRKTKTAGQVMVVTQKILRLINDSLLTEKEIAAVLANLNYFLSPENHEGE